MSAERRPDYGRSNLTGVASKLLMSYVLFEILRVIIQDSGSRRN